MPYAIIKDAIQRKTSLTGQYDYYVRHFSPHVLGDDRQGRKSVLGFQYGGGRPQGLPASGEWCFFQVNGLLGIRPNGDRWLAGPIDAKPLHLFSHIDVQA